uniref:RNA-dependent RNA polymerase n=1 Tax=Mito-like spartanusvirus TaxID=2784742 RepID=A0A7S7BW41_9VIRU|nr:RNA-dependent RNA polymerase [Mito-like spartanusvirus]
MMKTKTSFRFDINLSPIVRLLRGWWRSSRIASVYMGITDYQVYLFRVSRACGEHTAAKHGKEIYQRAKNYVLGSPLPEMKVFWFKTSFLGVLPRKLVRLERLLARESKISRVLCLTILSCYRLVNHPIKVSYSGALDPYSGTFWDKHLFHKCFEPLRDKFNLGRLKPKCPEPDVWTEYMGSNGPHSVPCILGASGDAVNLLKPGPVAEKLRQAVIGLSASIMKPFSRVPMWIPTWAHRDPELLLCQRLQDNAKFAKESMSMDAKRTLWKSQGKEFLRDPLNIKYRSCFARYVFLSEGGGKTRCVTPVNYYIQQALKPYHDYFMSCLRLIPMDCSFDEEHGKKMVRIWSGRGRSLSSIDMTEATDRAPRKWMVEVAENLLGKEFAQLWLDLMGLPIQFGKSRMTERPFRVGAPMGIYCLWPVFTLFHHTLVQIAAYRAGRHLPFMDYVMRGDDVVIADDDVAKEYMKLLDEFGLKFSPSKSYICKPGVAEFAKSIFLWGVDYSPISVRQLKSGFMVDPFCVPDLLNRFCKLCPPSKGQQVPHSALTWFIRKRSACAMLHEYLLYEPNRRIRSLLPPEWRSPEGWYRDGKVPREVVDQIDQQSSDEVAAELLKDLQADLEKVVPRIMRQIPITPKLVIEDDYDLPIIIRIYWLTQKLDYDRSLAVQVLRDRPAGFASRVLDQALMVLGLGSHNSGRSLLNNRRYRLSKYLLKRSRLFEHRYWRFEPGSGLYYL